MIIQLLTSAAALGLSISLGYAGRCSHEIDRVQARVDAKLEGLAGAGPSAVESTAALRHHQPTPGSIAAAERKVGDISPETVTALTAGMTRARAADLAGDQSACELELAGVLRVIGE
jgi:hypothetical protein